MDEQDIYKKIRQIAKTNKYQMRYSLAKELQFKLFQNDSELSHLQLIFLNHLIFYSNIYMDIALKEVDEIVTTNEIYEDAWMYYKHNKKPKEEVKVDSTLPKQQHTREKTTGETFHWVFKRPNKGVKK